MNKINTLLHGDCLELMKDIEDASIDMILCDLPYGVTGCKWDSIIPLDLMWEQYKRIIKPHGAIVLTAAQPFTSNLVMSNIKMFKYEWIWHKNYARGFQCARFRPMQNHESVVIFCKERLNYYPILTEYDKPITKKNTLKKTSQLAHSIGGDDTVLTYTHRQPTSIIGGIKGVFSTHCLHPTQKPVELFEYLIKTYTLEGELVLDNCIGSGTTAIACKNINRNWIGMESDKEIYNVALKRING